MSNFLGDLNLRSEQQKKAALEEALALETAKQVLLEQAVELEEAKEKPKKKEFLLLQPKKKKEEPLPPFAGKSSHPPALETEEVEEEVEEIKVKKPIEFSILKLTQKKPTVEKPVQEVDEDTGWDTESFETVAEKIVEVPVEKIVERIVEVPVEKIVEKEVEKIVEVPVKAEVMADLDLFTKLLEGVFQDINSLEGVKQVVEKVQALVEEQGSLTIKDYEEIVGSVQEPIEEPQEEIATSSRYKEGALATNPDTGEKVIYRKGKWQRLDG